MPPIILTQAALHDALLVEMVSLGRFQIAVVRGSSFRVGQHAVSRLDVVEPARQRRTPHCFGTLTIGVMTPDLANKGGADFGLRG